MATRNEVTKKLKTGQRVTSKNFPRWAILDEFGDFNLFSSRKEARYWAPVYKGGRIVRLNPITGVVSK